MRTTERVLAACFVRSRVLFCPSPLCKRPNRSRARICSHTIPLYEGMLMCRVLLEWTSLKRFVGLPLWRRINLGPSHCLEYFDMRYIGLRTGRGSLGWLWLSSLRSAGYLCVGTERPGRSSEVQNSHMIWQATCHCQVLECWFFNHQSFPLALPFSDFHLGRGWCLLWTHQIPRIVGGISQLHSALLGGPSSWGWCGMALADVSILSLSWEWGSPAPLSVTVVGEVEIFLSFFLPVSCSAAALSFLLMRSFALLVTSLIVGWLLWCVNVWFTVCSRFFPCLLLSWRHSCVSESGPVLVLQSLCRTSIWGTLLHTHFITYTARFCKLSYNFELFWSSILWVNTFCCFSHCFSHELFTKLTNSCHHATVSAAFHIPIARTTYKTFYFLKVLFSLLCIINLKNWNIFLTSKQHHRILVIVIKWLSI